MNTAGKTILMIGAFDSKEAEFNFMRELIMENGFPVLSMNIGTMGTASLFKPDIEASEVAKAAGANPDELSRLDRGHAVRIMSEGAPAIVRCLFEQGKFDAVIGMGGGGGTSVITSAMRILPIGVPKVCLSTMTGGDISAYIGLKDIVMIPSICDICGINKITGMLISQAVGAVCGMASAEVPVHAAEKPLIFISVFGNTNRCAEMCILELSSIGYEVLPFHATGTGGRIMESLVYQGFAEAVLDLTTTEWADTLCGGIQGAGEERLDAPGQMGIPHLIVPGCLDMVNFGPRHTIPERFAGRNLYEWNPDVTLIRTNQEENKKLGRILAEKANKAKGPVAFLLPLKGISILDGDNQPFCDRQADNALFDAIKANLHDNIPVYELDNNINDKDFAEKAVKIILQMQQEKKGR